MTEKKQGDVTPQGASPDSQNPASEKDETAQIPQIPQEQWQMMKEEAKKEAKAELANEFTNALGIKGEGDPLKLFVSLKESNSRKDCEASHPELRTSKYLESWNKLCEEHFELLQAGKINHEKLYYMLIGQLGKPESELEKPLSSSVPVFSKSIPQKGTAPSKETRTWYRSKGITDEEWQKLKADEEEI